MKTRTSKITSKKPRKTAQNPAKPAAETKPLAATVPVEPASVSQTERPQLKLWHEYTREERIAEVDKMWERSDWQEYSFWDWHLLIDPPESEIKAAEGVRENRQSKTESAANELPASPV